VSSFEGKTSVRRKTRRRMRCPEANNSWTYFKRVLPCAVPIVRLRQRAFKGRGPLLTGLTTSRSSATHAITSQHIQRDFITDLS
jgi:hypothetical protein